MKLTRRAALGGLAGLAGATSGLKTPAWAAAATDVQLLLGGTLTSIPGQFAELANAALSRSLDLDTPLELTPDIGQDGVRAANLFDANSAPDGNTALAFPGSTLLASLTGDTRVHYDFGRWTPVLVASTTTVVIARTELHKTLRSRLTGFFHDHPVRLAVSHIGGPELNALMGLSLLGLRPIPVVGYVDSSAALSALHAGDVDAVQISPYTLDRPLDDVLANLPEGTGAIYYTGDLTDTHSSNIPIFLEAYQQARRRAPEGPFYHAWQAVSASADTAMAIALPMLTPPEVVGKWSRACSATVSDSGVRHWADLHHFKLATGENAEPFLSRTVPDLGATLALRRWLAVNTPRWRQGQETRHI
ncbi:type 2 periplasmic-binding domain-containing protein [Gluconobacter kanchanaburiensis]|uniref:ABC transporter substrate-binding protein n=1 Tax=Gluconobacter kanchanaburiensis NBRC 103587 TaxID=1307948 RepID=A0A511B646_9PROT|nr:hypothetical protein [Gluconobacter kanchanaburiensis]MBF0860722.1 hypothetical protein [Gluconobacter kanchanaburiensis]GBR69672.1 hypothetical protein AA103587_1455 [Gluconobacter kanchanaburiensis NBRC 103587]GEK95101.1 hypothetical protein GKA01_02980 [Gluconobacter kanchanaburiensis NBRC 103587]